MKVHNNKTDTDYAHALMDIEGEHCHLQHNKQHDPAVEHPAVEYLVQYLGKTDGVIQEVEHELRIPICQDCMDGLSDPKWFLVYCISCNESQWIYRPLCYKPLPDEHIQWLDECPNCRK